MKFFKEIILLFATILFATACAPIRYDHNLVGKVVDSQTGEPIPGTVILAEWIKSHVTLAGGHGSFYDARETVADDNGEFRIPGRGLRFFTIVETSHAYVFKAGYNWVGIDYERLIESNGIVRLRNIMDNKELMMERQPPRPTDAPSMKMQAYITEINKVRTESGYEPYRIIIPKDR